MIKRNEIWNFLAEHYESLWVQKHSLKPTRQLVMREVSKLLGTTVPKDGKLLDMGCGTGQLISELAEEFPRSRLELTGMDASQEMIAQAEKKRIPGVRFLTGDVHQLPFPDHSFEIITCCHSFPYYRNKSVALKELARVTKPGGHLLLIQASENNIYDKLVMTMVKFTTSSASYPSITATAKLLGENGLSPLEQIRLKTASYLPNIVLTISSPGVDHENSAY